MFSNRTVTFICHFRQFVGTTHFLADFVRPSVKFSCAVGIGHNDASES